MSNDDEVVPDTIDETDGSESEEELESDSDDISRDSLSDLYSGEENARAAVEALRGQFDSVDLDSDQMIELDSFDATYTLDVNGDVTQTGPDSKTQQIEVSITNYCQNDVGMQGRKGRLWARVKGYTLFLGFVSAGTSLASVIVAANAAATNTNQPPSSVTPADTGLDPELSKMLEQQVERWQNLSDADVWRRVSAYCDQWNPSWQAQILLMDTIKRLARKLPAEWAWRDDDKADAVYATVDAFGAFKPTQAQRQSSEIYRFLATRQYDGYEVSKSVVLPRQVAADVAQLAIGIIVLRNQTSGSGS